MLSLEKRDNICENGESILFIFWVTVLAKSGKVLRSLEQITQIEIQCNSDNPQ